MNSVILTIMKKELFRFFTDKRMVLTTLILPGAMIYLLYSFMGTAMQEQYMPDDTEDMVCKVINYPKSMGLDDVFSEQKLKMKEIVDSEKEIKQAKNEIEEKETQLLIVFPKDFQTQVDSYEIENQNTAPEIQVYYSSAEKESAQAFSVFEMIMDSYETQLVNKFDMNRDSEISFDLSSEKDQAVKMMSTMLPFLLLVFLYSGCVSIAPESIAGEKERGTMASLLITPAKRSDIAIGKIGALSIIAVLSGISSTIGTMAALPKLIQDSQTNISAKDVYRISDYLLLGVVILSTALVIITLISLISAFAKSIKEAQTYVTPIMILVMMVGITAMFGDGVKVSLTYYFIPLYNSVQVMVGIFSNTVTIPMFLITIVSNFLATGLGAVVLSKMFSSEYVMFHK